MKKMFLMAALFVSFPAVAMQSWGPQVKKAKKIQDLPKKRELACLSLAYDRAIHQEQFEEAGTVLERMKGVHEALVSIDPCKKRALNDVLDDASEKVALKKRVVRLKEVKLALAWEKENYEATALQGLSSLASQSHFLIAARNVACLEAKQAALTEEIRAGVEAYQSKRS